MSRPVPGTDPVLVVGFQRSGTTALGLAVAAAADAAGGRVTVNGKLFYLLARWGETRGQHFRADEVAHALRRRRPLGPGTEAWLRDVDGALEAAARRVAHGLAADARTEARTICHDAYGGARVWGDKYNEYLLDLPFLHALFPAARWAFILRDPRAVAASLLAWGGRRPWNPSTAAAGMAKWEAWNDAWFRFRSSVPAARRVELLYEDVRPSDVERLSALVGADVAPHLDHRPSARPPVVGDPSAMAAWAAFKAALGRP